MDEEKWLKLSEAKKLKVQACTQVAEARVSEIGSATLRRSWYLEHNSKLGLVHPVLRQTKHRVQEGSS
jgi:hypothetical protein